MGKLIRCITNDGAVMATCVDTTDIVNKAEGYHKTSAVVTAALGRLLTAASMMGNMLKTEDGSLTLRVMGEGPAGTLVAVSDSHGNVRGYATNPVVELPLNSKGKLDVARSRFNAEGMDVLLLCQPAAELDLYGTVDGAVCCLDSLNHIIYEDELRDSIAKVSLFLEPERLFIFDVNTEYKHRDIL